MRAVRVASVLTVVLLLSVPAMAQLAPRLEGLDPAVVSGILPRTIDRNPLERSLSAAARTSYYLEGLIVGAVVVGVTGGMIAHSLCANADVPPSGSCAGRSILGSLLGAAVGAGVGALVGGLFPKGARESREP
jgi:hypothetical protein